MAQRKSKRKPSKAAIAAALRVLNNPKTKWHDANKVLKELAPRLLLAPHPLATELCLLKAKLTEAGLYITAQRLGIAIKAIGWEIQARAEDPPCPPLPKFMIPVPETEKGRERALKKHQAQHKRACAAAKRTAWKEIDKLPKCPL